MSPSLLMLGLAISAAAGASEEAQPGAAGGPGLALHAAKVLTCAWDGPLQQECLRILMTLFGDGAGFECFVKSLDCRFDLLEVRVRLWC